ncbi:MAG: hypothetical protein ACYCZX_01560 [Rhodospirillaceae bacterium]
MAMKMMLDGATPFGGAQIWRVVLAPYEVTRLGSPRVTQGTRSVVLAETPVFFAPTKTLQLDLAGVTVLNLGTTDDVLIIGFDQSATTSSAGMTAKEQARGGQMVGGPGDQEFLRLVDRELRGPAAEAAKGILREIRLRHPGDLQRGQRSNFKNMPDNFWYVIVQPRVQSLSITVRGTHTKFQSSVLKVKEDRPGYTRFTLRNPAEVPEALRIIELSKRK